MNMLLKKIGQVAIFLICAQTLLHFRAKDSYEKYIKLLINMMLLILLAEPLLNLLSIGEATGVMDKIQGYEKTLEAVLEKGLMDEEEMEDFLLDIMTQKVEQGMEYVQVQALQNQEMSQEIILEENEENVQVTPVTVEKIKVGGKNGEP